MKHVVAVWVLVAGLLEGCAHYAPAPISTAAYPETAAARTLAQPAGARWDMPDLLARALAANPAVAEGRARYRAALAAARTARAGPAPSLTLSTEYAFAADGTSPWLFGLAGELPIDRGARRAGRLAAADLAALQALYDYGEAIWRVRTDLSRALVERVEAEAEGPVAEALVATRGDRASAYRRRVAAGEDAQPDGVPAQIDLLAAQRRLAEVRARRLAADAALAAALAVDPVRVQGLRLALDARAVDDALLPQWREAAALSRRDVLRAVADYDAAEAALRVEVARQSPQVSLGPGYSWDHGVSKLPFNLVLALPPLDLNRAAIAEAEARRAAAGRSLEAVQAAALADVDRTAAAYAAAVEAEAAARRQLDPLVQQADAARRRSVAGEADRMEPLGAESLVLEARLDALEARRQRELAIVDLEDALRRPFDPAETAILAAPITATEVGR